MSDHPVLGAGKITLDLTGGIKQIVAAHSALVASMKSTLTNGAVSMPAGNSFKDRVQVKPEKKFADPLANITLKFQVDSSTNDITILLVDRVSHEVVRTIPPEEMSKMDPGELLELFT